MWISHSLPLFLPRSCHRPGLAFLHGTSSEALCLFREVRPKRLVAPPPAAATYSRPNTCLPASIIYLHASTCRTCMYTYVCTPVTHLLITLPSLSPTLLPHFDPRHVVTRTWRIHLARTLASLSRPSSTAGFPLVGRPAYTYLLPALPPVAAPPYLAAMAPTQVLCHPAVVSFSTHQSLDNQRQRHGLMPVPPMFHQTRPLWSLDDLSSELVALIFWHVGKPPGRRPHVSTCS